jgi:hypothetical protein
MENAETLGGVYRTLTVKLPLSEFNIVSTVFRLNDRYKVLVVGNIPLFLYSIRLSRYHSL